jgi:hypothetical protein
MTRDNIQPEEAAMSGLKASPNKPILLSDATAAEALAREQELNRQRLAQDDAARAAGGTITMVCVTPFTLIDNPAGEGRVVHAGEELEIPLVDEHAYTGRLRRKPPKVE